MQLMKRDQKMEIAVFTMLEGGPMSPEKSMLFEDTLAAMVAKKMIKRLPDGGHDLVSRAPSQETQAKKETMITLTFRAPAAFRDMLDRIGPTRSEALRKIIEKVAEETAAEKGSRKQKS